MMKTGLILFSLLLHASLAGAESFTVESLREKSQLQPGRYRLAEGADRGCDEGELEFLPNDGGYVTLMLGASPLIPRVGPPQKGGEREMKWESTSSVRDRRIQWIKTGTFKGEPTRFDVTITVQNQGFTYVALLRGKYITCPLLRY